MSFRIERPKMSMKTLTRLSAAAAPLAAGAAVLAAPGVAGSQTNDQPLAGYWTYTTSVLGVRDTETKCVRPSEINRFFGGLSTRKWQCVYPVRVVGNDVLVQA